jgi:hypothetical protein
MSRARVLIAVLLLSGLLSACGPAKDADKPSYRAVPDKELFARIARLPGVTKVAVTYSDTFTSTNSYAGNVYVKADASSKDVLDKTLAILWQGHPGAAMTSVAVAPQGKVQVFPADLGLMSRKAYVDRYGPQPGDGKP